MKEKTHKKTTRRQQQQQRYKHSFVVYLQHYGAIINLGNGHQWHKVLLQYLYTETSLSQ